jgi:hypothetical protein
MDRSTKIAENTDKLLKFVVEKFQSNELDNHSLVELIQVAGSYLNLITISDYARDEGITYEGAK